MMKSAAKFIFVFTVICSLVIRSEAQSESGAVPKILPDTVDGVARQDMMRSYLLNKVRAAHQRWQNNFEARLEEGGSEAYYKDMRENFMRAIGDSPVSTPLNPMITGVLNGDGFTIEKVIFESQPKHIVTANFYLPDRQHYPEPWPGVLVPCGHYQVSKAHDEYQSMGALLALNGMAALVYDPVDQGERLQIRGKMNDFPYWGTRAHTINDIRAILLGGSMAGHMIRDGMRAIDYLVSRGEIDADKIGCTGNSGGGTQTSYLMALDERIKAAAPSCYIHHLESQIINSMGDAEQNIYRQISFGMDHPDYLMMRAPLPVKILAATNDFFKIDAVWETFRNVKRYYSTLGYSENVDILENNAGHNYNRLQREAAARWLSRWLLGNESPIIEPELVLFTEEQLRCTAEGQTLLRDDAKSVQDIQIEQLDWYLKQRAERHRTLSAKSIRDTIRAITGIRRFEEIPDPIIEHADTIEREDYLIEKLVMIPESGIYIPVVRYKPTGNSQKGIILYLDQEGKDLLHLKITEIEQHIRNGNQVIMADLRGIGETAQTGQVKMGKLVSLDWADWYTSYLLGENYVSMRCEDLFNCLKIFPNSPKMPVTVKSYGNIGIPVLHAAALEPDLFNHVEISGCIASWEEIIRSPEFYDQLSGIVRGALRFYDLPDLVSLAEGKVNSSNPANVSGVTEEMVRIYADLSDKPSLAGLAGIWYGSLNLKDPVGFDPVSVLEHKWDQTAQRGRTWSAEWFGYVIAPESGRISLIATTDQELKIVIGDYPMLALDKKNNTGMIPFDAVKGKSYPIYIRYNQDSSDSGSISVKWKMNGKPVTPIPPESLKHSPKDEYKMNSAGR